MGHLDKNYYYREVVGTLAADDNFIRLLEVGQSREARTAVSNCLIACLESFKAPATMTGCADVFSDFASFCGNPAFRDSVPSNIQGAWQARRWNINEAARSRRIFTFKAGLNWKSPLQAIRRKHKLAGMPCWVAIDLGVPYPPPGHWIAENNAIYDLWKDYLDTRKMCDTRMPSHPIHQLDPGALMHDIPPDQGTIFRDFGALIVFFLPRFTYFIYQTS